MVERRYEKLVICLNDYECITEFHSIKLYNRVARYSQEDVVISNFYVAALDGELAVVYWILRPRDNDKLDDPRAELVIVKVNVDDEEVEYVDPDEVYEIIVVYSYDEFEEEAARAAEILAKLAEKERAEAIRKALRRAEAGAGEGLEETYEEY